MTRHDTIISELIDALAAVDRATMYPNTPDDQRAALAYISGIAKGAIARANRQRERNRDGYLVVKA